MGVNLLPSRRPLLSIHPGSVRRTLLGVNISHRSTVASHLRQHFAAALRIAIVCACLVGAWLSWKLERADELFRQETAQALRSAIQIEPDAWDYYIRLAQIDDSHAQALLETALRLNRYNAGAAIELGLHYETEGDYARAEKVLLQASEVDRTYLPRWSLANFYLRRNNLAAFWVWARRAAEMPSEDIGALFDLCWRVFPDPDEIARMVVNDKPEVLRQYLNFLITKNQLNAVAATAQRLIATGTAGQDRPLLLSLVNQLITANDAIAASAVWRDLIERRWVVAESSVPNNSEFTRDPLPVSFDWAISSYNGLHSWPGPVGLETEFTGGEPESCEIAEQIVILGRGDYTMEYSYRTTKIPVGTGIRWQLIDVKSGATLAESTYLSSEAPKHETVPFSIQRDASLLSLRLLYQRPVGTTRISGTLVIRSIDLKVHRSA